MDLKLEKKVFYTNIKIISFNIIALALVYIGAIYLMVNINSLSEDSIIFIGEQFLSPIGIGMFVRIGLIENEYKVGEMVYLKSYSYWKTIFYRIIIVSIQLFLILAIAFIPVKFIVTDFKIINILLGTYITSFYLGAIGMTIGYITKEISIGILVPFIYYFFEMFSKGKLTKGLYLFGMIVGDYTSKLKLFSIAVVITIIFLFTIKKEVLK